MVLWFVTMVESSIRNLHMAYAQVWAHDLYRYMVLAVVVGQRILVLVEPWDEPHQWGVRGWYLC